MTMIKEKNEPEKEHPKKDSKQHRHLVGFLFSYSKTQAGEFWPLYEGKNIVGSHKNCDVALYEEQVSNPHAHVFAIRKKGEDKLEFRIQDAGSETSTIVDGEQLMVGDVATLKNRSRIVIGGYELIVVLIDYLAEGFVPNEAFQPAKKAGDDLSMLKGMMREKPDYNNSNRTTTD